MNEENLPIDIQVKKLLDWLISRRICNKDWHDHIIKIREKIGLAIRDMPEHKRIKDLLSGTHINYFHCVEIVEILAETEKDSKNFLGMYGSQRMKDWKDIVSNYNKGNVYLAEAAQLLSQSVTYEIPGLKKQIQKTLQVTQECEKKEKEFLKKSAEVFAEFEKARDQLGLKGLEEFKKSDIRKSVIELLKELPKIYRTIAEDSKVLKKTRDMYIDFIGDNKIQILPTLGYLMDHGNVTTYQWIHGEAPISIEEPTLNFDEEKSERKKDEPNEEEEEEEGSEIDFGDSEDNVEIDWGNLDDSEPVDDEIDWGNVDDVDVGEIVVEEGGVDGGVARDTDALSLLDNRRTRSLILDELSELECFLRQRLFEIRDSETYSLVEGSGIARNPEVLKSSLKHVTSLIRELSTGKLHHLQLIRSSAKYVDRIAENLRSKIDLSEKMKNKAAEFRERQKETLKMNRENSNKTEIVVDKARILQKNIEKDISKRYKNRKVNVVGGV